MTRFSAFNKDKRMTELCKAIQYCSLCPRLSSRTKIYSELNGNINTKVLFVAEAPGRLGADRTRIPLYGDKTGDNFCKLLGNISWKRKEIFITNAVLCNPREENGNNDTPTINEVKNCSIYLEMTLILIQPDVVVTLGKTALEALNILTPHPYKLKENVGKLVPWSNIMLMPLYHPGPRAFLHRSLVKQRADFMKLSKLVDPIHGLIMRKRTEYGRQEKLFDFAVPTPLQRVIVAIVEMLGQITYFKLTKLLYLIDLKSLRKLGHTVTGEIYIRQEEGPWPPSLKTKLTQLKDREIISSFAQSGPRIRPGPSPRFRTMFSYDTLNIITEVIHEYGRFSNAKLKSAVYLTKPLKYVLKEEKKGRDMRKVPLIYKDKIATELDTSIIRSSED